jgi:oligosaccharide repeat unit polymerase
MNFILFFFFTVFTVLFLTRIWNIKRGNPLFYFSFFQWIIGSGSLLLLDLNNFTDLIYGIVIYTSQFLFIFGALVGIKVFNIRKNYDIYFDKPIEVDPNITTLFVVLLTFLSALIVIIYYQAIGYNLMFTMISANDLIDFKSARLATYSGENYYAPGFVNQFKNILLPIGLTIISLNLFLNQRKILFYLSIFVFGVFILYALLGTGQRAPLLYAMFSIGIGLSLIYKIKLRYIGFFISTIIVLFAIISVNSGRVVDENINAIMSIFIRIFYVDQLEGLIGFRYIYELDYSWFYEWSQGMLGILPGHSGSSLEHELYNNLHGTPRGTSSISIPASVYYNGSLLSVFILFFILGIGYAYIYSRLLIGRRTVVRNIGYGGLIFILSVFVMGSPVTLLNKGVLAYMLILFIRKLRIYEQQK